MRNVVLILFFLLMSFVSKAQSDSIKLVKYSSGFRFKDGIYLNHEQLVNNNPIRKSMIISKYSKKDYDFYTKLLSEETITYFNRYGLKKELYVNDIWGFSRRGSIYINWGDDFNRIPVLGNVCHFVASITTQDQQSLTPMYGYTPYAMPPTTSKTQVNQYLLLFNSGEILEYTVDNVERILKRDSVLYEEFIALKKRKKRDMKFLYIRKLNEKYPLYIPIE